MILKRKLFYLIICLLATNSGCFGPPEVIAQTLNSQKEIGIPPHRDFLPQEYRANGQNFAILADKRGVMYFANFAGILEYDGTSWRTILTPNISKVNTLARDAAGTIYVGARGELGYLAPDSTGETKFISLSPALEKHKIFSPDVRKCFATAKGILFLTNRELLKWNGKGFEVIRLPSPLLNAFYVRDKLYVLMQEGGLQVFENNNWLKIPGGNQFSELVFVNALLPAGPDSLFIGSGNQGLYLLNKNRIRSFSSPANYFLIRNRISCGIKLKDGAFAFGTSDGGPDGGILIMEKKGGIRQIFNKRLSGLYDNRVNFMYQDPESGLWVAMNRGLTRIELNTNLAYFDAKKNVSGTINGIARFRNQLYISSDEGLFYFNNQNSLFQPVAGIKMACWGLAASDQTLLVATSNGVYAYDGRVMRLILSGFALSLYQSRYKPGIFYVGMINCVGQLELKNGAVRELGHLTGIKDEVRGIAEDELGNLWLELPAKGLLRLPDHLPGGQKLYTSRQGLPNHTGLHLNPTSFGLLIGTVAGAYQYQPKTDLFKPADLSGVDAAHFKNWIATVQEDLNQGIWVTSGNETDISYFRKTPAGYQRNLALLPIKDHQVFRIFPEPNGTVWLGGTDNLISFDSRLRPDLEKKHVTLIRSITINSDTLYRGNGPLVKLRKGNSPLELKSNKNNIRFEFSTPLSMQLSDYVFNHYLEGLEEKSGNWSQERSREYSNLPPGNYIFHVRSRDVFGVLSEEATFAFHINKPYYATIWAYLVYFLLAAGLVFLVVRLRSRQLLKEKRKLEALIKERTEEVVLQKEEIENQSRELASKNDELEKINTIVKSINAEINFNSLLQSILDKTKIIRGTEKASMLVWDKETELFRFKAYFGFAAGYLENITFKKEEVENRYLSGGEEVFEDIVVIRSARHLPLQEKFPGIVQVKSMLIMVVKLQGQLEAFLILENGQKQNAFVERDFSLLRNLKEHFIAAFIKTDLLESIQKTLINLKNTQDQLIRQEKLASIGQLTKGIVDRILNPLNYINNFSSLSRDLILETRDLLEHPAGQEDQEEILENLETVTGNLQKVNDHGQSASRIVKGMEKILREKSTTFVETDLNKLVETNIKATSAEVKKEFPGIEIFFRTQLDEKNSIVRILPAEMGSVMSNLLNNACFSVAEKLKVHPDLKPEVMISTHFEPDSFEIKIHDNGKGIPAKELTQLFSPFFTTKPTAKGTGLGLYLSQDIVKEHKGAISVDTKEGEFTEFIITIPR